MDLWKKKTKQNKKNMSNADIFWLPLSNHIKSKGKFLQDFTSQIDSLCFLLSQPLKERCPWKTHTIFMDAIQKYVWNCDDEYILNLSRRTQQFKMFFSNVL